VISCADEGTLFLDEVAELCPIVRQAAARARWPTIPQIGGTQDIQVSVRIVAASNTRSRRRGESGRFREDLYYRLKW